MAKKDKKQEEQNPIVENGNSEQNDVVAQLEQELAEANEKIEELTDGYKRAAADLQNFKRRVEEDQKNLVSFANSNLILEILPILDNFERALEHQPENVPQEWFDGILQIYNHFKQILEKQGVEEIKSEGEKYDPNFHEAMLHCEGEDGIIVQELEKGYLLKGKVVRPAKVSVGNGS